MTVSIHSFAKTIYVPENLQKQHGKDFCDFPQDKLEMYAWVEM